MSPFEHIVSVHTDQYGCVVQTDGDGGDSLNRQGLMGVAIAALSPRNMSRCRWFYQINRRYQDLHGEFRRHPNPMEWWSDTKVTTRDQMIPNWIAWGFVGPKSTLEHWWTQHKRRFLFFQNTRYPLRKGGITWLDGWKFPDITGPSHLASIFRARGSHPWAVCVLDWFMFADAIFAILQKRKDPGHFDIINTFCMFWQSSKIFQTWPSKMAGRLLVKNLPGGLQAMFDGYFRPGTNAPPFNELFRPIIEEYERYVG